VTHKFYTPMNIDLSSIERLSKSIRQFTLQAAQAEAELTDLCIITGLSREEAKEAVAKSPLDAGELASFFRATGASPWKEKKSVAFNWSDLTNFDLVDDRRRSEKIKDAVEDFLLDRLYRFWYGLFFLLFGLLVTPIRAGWDSLKDCWVDAGYDSRDE